MSAHNRKLAFVFLANDIVQNSRKKGPGAWMGLHFFGQHVRPVSGSTEFVVAFSRVMAEALRHTAKHGDEAVTKSIEKMLGVWEDRRVFGARVLQEIKEALSAARKQGGGGPSSRDTSTSAALLAAYADVQSAVAAVAPVRRLVSPATPGRQCRPGFPPPAPVPAAVRPASTLNPSCGRPSHPPG